MIANMTQEVRKTKFTLINLWLLFTTKVWVSSQTHNKDTKKIKLLFIPLLLINKPAPPIISDNENVLVIFSIKE